MTVTLKTAMAGVDIDIGKTSFHVVGLDQRVLRQKVIATPSGRAICHMPPVNHGSRTTSTDFCSKIGQKQTHAMQKRVPRTFAFRR
jgi:uncharacterized 2Fe-2S/4Fe-4S cluster protein (DUF4445 family)